MLNFMRRHAQSWLIKVALGAIVVVFIFWGIGTFRISEEGVAARVNGESISVREYQSAYDRLLRAYRDAFRDRFSDEMLRRFNLRQQALDNLVNRTLLLQEARRLHLLVSEDELRRSIAAYPAFQVNGRFSQEQYVRLLRANRWTPEQFEEGQREDLLLAKLEGFIRASAKVSPREVEEAYRLSQERVNLEYLPLKVKEFEREVTVTDADLQAYYERSKAAFQVPARLRLRPVDYSVEAFLGDVRVSPREVEDYYQTNPRAFQEAPRVKLRQIFLKSSSQDAEEARRQVQARAAEVRQKAALGENFAQLARQYSEDDSAKAGGDLGFVTRGQLLQPLDDAAFSLKPGELSQVIATDVGFHILRVDEAQPGRTLPLAEVRDRILTRLRADRARDLALDRAEKAHDLLLEQKSPEDAARATGGGLKPEQWIAQGERPEGVEEEQVTPLFSLRKGEVSQVLKGPQGYRLFKVLDRQEARVPPLSEIRDKVRAKVVEQKAQERARARGEELLAEMKKGKRLRELDRAAVKETGLFGRGEIFIPGIGPSQELRLAAFTLTPAKPYGERPSLVGDAVYLIALKERKATEMKDFDKARPAMQQALLSEKGAQLFQQWLEQVRARSKITMNPRMVGETKGDS